MLVKITATIITIANQDNAPGFPEAVSYTSSVNSANEIVGSNNANNKPLIKFIKNTSLTLYNKGEPFGSLFFSFF